MSKKLLMGITIVLAILLLFTLISPSFGADPKTFKPNVDGTAAQNIQDAGESVIGIIQVIGTAVAIVMLIWLGIKYVVAAPDEKAEIKKSAFIYVVAAVFIFGAVNILAMLKNFSEDVTNTTTPT